MFATKRWSVLLTLCLLTTILYLTFPIYDRQIHSVYNIDQDGRLSDREKADAIKDAFVHGWDGYMKYAFPNDALKPLTKSYVNTRSGWGATAVDSLTTAIMMDMPDVVDTILDHVKNIKFAETNLSVSVIGTTMRYLGAFLSAHDLLTGPSSHMDPTGSYATTLLSQAQSFAETIAFSFNTSSPVPQNNLAIRPQPRRKKSKLTDITAAGSLALEWGHLSYLINSTIGIPALKSFNYLLSQPQQSNLFPGLLPKDMWAMTGKFHGLEGGWYGGAGGFYEYLLKYHIYSPTQYPGCRDRWIQVAESTMAHLASHPLHRPNLTFIASYNGTSLLYDSDHTAHFAAANFILGGATLGVQKYIDFGLALLDSAIEMQRATATGIGPDNYAWIPDHCAKYDLATLPSPSTPKECTLPAEHKNQTAFLTQAGYYITSAPSFLRPEVFESCYYAYRVTKNPKYRDASWSLFQALVAHTRIDTGGFTELVDVNVLPHKSVAVNRLGERTGEGGMNDRMLSFVLAETVKYAWLVWVEEDDDRQPWHVCEKGMKGWVFNTEGHPLRVRER